MLLAAMSFRQKSLCLHNGSKEVGGYMNLNSSLQVFLREDFKLVSINVDALKDEMNGLQEFLEKKLSVKIKVEGKVMNVGSEEELPRGKVKDCVERFFYRKGLSDTYAVKSQKDEITIVKKKT